MGHTNPSPKAWGLKLLNISIFYLVRRQTVAGIPFIDSKWMKGHPRISAMIPNKLRKADSEQNFLAAHADVFENYDSRRKVSEKLMLKIFERNITCI